MQQVIAEGAVRAAITKAKATSGAQLRLLDRDEEERRLRRRSFIASRTHEILADIKWNEKLIEFLLDTERGRDSIWDVRRANAGNWISAMHRFQTLLTEAAEWFAIREANKIHGAE